MEIIYDEEDIKIFDDDINYKTLIQNINKLPNRIAFNNIRNKNQGRISINMSKFVNLIYLPIEDYSRDPITREI